MGDAGAERTNRERTERFARSAAVVIDPRLADLWQVLWKGREEADEPVSEEVLAAALRLAYVQGYSDAQSESPGALWRTLGLRVSPGRSARR